MLERAAGLCLAMSLALAVSQSALVAQSTETPSNGEAASSRPQPAADAGFIAHEWGTFTSFQTSDGTLLSWRPLETSQLPAFVYNWQKPGPGRTGANLLTLGKGSVTSLQRMETPVIYFYGSSPQDIDVTVKFPQGTISEWYPQAGQVGPSTASSLNSDSTPGKINPASPESLIRWPDVRIRSGAEDHSPLPPNDNSGSHYYAARDTDARMIQIEARDTNAAQAEKFLFYRGVGNFSTPLRVTMKSDDGVDIANTGDHPLTHLFVLAISKGIGRFVYVPELKAGEVKVVVIGNQKALPVDKLSDQLVTEVSAALAKTGLYPKEARAMANTWKDSWFQEEGVRVLYALPRDWTDQTLPLTMNPAPKELVRTMVGRAEVLSPGVETKLTSLMQRARQGDAVASGEARELLKTLGRFAPPAFERIISKMNPEPTEMTTLAGLLPVAHTPL